MLVLCRPYHADPGLHHGIPEEMQSLGYPIVSIRSIPKDPAWLARYFKEDVAKGRLTDPLDLSDVWPENYSTNSVMKVWAARFAARHPNIALLDLSSFKCGHDAPTYGLIDSIVKASGTPRLVLHDIDANKPARLDRDPHEDVRPRAPAAARGARGDRAQAGRADPPGRGSPAPAAGPAGAAPGLPRPSRNPPKRLHNGPQRSLKVPRNPRTSRLRADSKLSRNGRKLSCKSGEPDDDPRPQLAAALFPS